MSSPSAADLINGSSRAKRSASFLSIGDTFEGDLCSPAETVQARDMKTGELKTWPDGNPIWQIVLPVQTTMHRPDIENDDGVRYLYVDGSKKKGSESKHDAIATAMKAAGATDFEIGAHVKITYVGDGPKTGTSYPPKRYRAEWRRPASNAANLMGLDSPAQPAAPAEGPRNGDAGDAALEAAIRHLSPAQQNAIRKASIPVDEVKAMFPA
jgi:hypothetical protein